MAAISAANPHEDPISLQPITLNQKVWCCRNFCRYNAPFEVMRIYAELFWHFVGAMIGGLALNQFVFTVGAIGVATSFTISFGISGLIYLIFKCVEFIRHDELKRAMIDIVGGNESYKKLPRIYSEERNAVLPNPLPEHPIFIFNRLDTKNEDPPFYLTSMIVSFNDGSKDYIAEYAFSYNRALSNKKGALLPNEFTTHEINRKEALLLKELVLRGKCSFDPTNPLRKGDFRLGRLST